MHWGWILAGGFFIGYIYGIWQGRRYERRLIAKGLSKGIIASIMLKLMRNTATPPTKGKPPRVTPEAGNVTKH